MTETSSGSRGTNWLPKGTRLNDTYELDEGITSGGMGEIYRGHNIQTGSSYAIKMIRSDFADTEGAMTMFLREAGALNDLFHEAIVRYFAFSIDPTLRRPYMVMEFVTGRSLSEIIKSGPMDYEDVRVLGMRLAAGLQIAHDRGIIHRDIAPDNILVPDGDVSRAKIIDFGIARQTKGTEGTIIGDGFAGKYNYVSPEQLGMYDGNVGAASDIYSLALVLAEAVAGRSINMRGNQFEVIAKRQTVPDLRHIDVRLQPLLSEMLQPNPQDRPTSMTEVAGRLRVRGTTPPMSGGVSREETVIRSRREQSRAPGSDFFREQSSRESSWREPSSREPSSRDPSWNEPSQREPSWREPSSREPSRRGSAPSYRGGPNAGDTVFEEPRRQSSFPAYPGAPQGPVSERPGSDMRGPSRPPSARPMPMAHPAAPPAKSGGGSGILVAAAVVVALLAGGGGAAYWFLIAPKPQTIAQGQQVEPAKPQDKPVEPAKPADGPKPADPIRKETPPAAVRQMDVSHYLASYQGGSCFYINPIMVSDNQFVTEGFSHSIAPFEQLDQDFREKTGVEADIRLREVVDAQCPVVDFLTQTRVDGPSRPKIEVVDQSVKAGDPIVGEAKAPVGLYLTVMLVADDGSVKFIAQSDQPDGTPLPFQATSERLTNGGGKPGLIVAISSMHQLDVSGFQGKVFAGDVVDKIEADANKRGERLASAAQYLVLRR